MRSITGPTAETIADVRQFGTALIIAGVLGVIAGILAIVFPDVTLLALALIAGINLLLLGFVSLVDAFVVRGDSTARTLAAVLGLLGIIAGLVVIKHPGESLLAVVIVVGVWLVVNGIVDVVRALVSAEHRGLGLLGALVDIVLGILILSLPKLSLGTLAVLVGIAFVVRGALSIYRGARLRAGAHALGGLVGEGAAVEAPGPSPT